METTKTAPSECAKEEECSEEGLSAIGFMFDAEHSKELRKLSFTTAFPGIERIEMSIKTIGDRPGHVQSGQYLWPAAMAAAQHLIDIWGKESEFSNCDSIIELGAGCGVAGLVASKLPGVNSVIFTDYDPGSLALLEENVRLNSSKPLFVHFLEWGQPTPIHVRRDCCYPDRGFSLVIGTDLIYCKEVIEPLFITAHELLRVGGVFVLVSSFALENEYNEMIANICERIQLEHHVYCALDESKKQCKIDYFKKL